MPELHNLGNRASDFKVLSNDFYLVSAFYINMGWTLECFVSDVDTLEDALVFAVQERPNLYDHEVLVTQIGGNRSLRKCVKVEQLPAPAPEITLEELPDPEE